MLIMRLLLLMFYYKIDMIDSCFSDNVFRANVHEGLGLICIRRKRQQGKEREKEKTIGEKERVMAEQ